MALTLETLNSLAIASQRGRNERAKELWRLRSIDKGWFRWHYWADKRIQEIKGPRRFTVVDVIRRARRIED